MAKAEPAGERRDDGLLRDDRLDMLHRRRGGIALGDGLIQHRLRDGAGLHQLHLALVIEIGLVERRLVVGEIGLLDRGVELDELLALLDVLTAVEVIVGDHAAELRRDVDAFDGDQRADGAQPVDPVFRLGDLGGHRRRRRHHLRHEVGDHLRLEHEVEIANPAQKQADDDCGDDKALNHVAVACSPRARVNPVRP